MRKYDKQLERLEHLLGLAGNDDITRIEVDFVDMDFSVASRLIRIKDENGWREEWFEHPH